ncbi:MAG: DUF1553 domain-containing protein [Planctomycetota bacterium]|nr:DUF1553 domain-containing protein [Planctomycetota bacterium]
MASLRNYWLKSLLTAYLLGIVPLHAIAKDNGSHSSAALWNKMKDVLSEKCFACHGRLKQEAGLRLETRNLILNGGESGKTVDLEAPLASLIWQRVSAEADSRMPPEGEGSALTSEELELLRNWLQAGAPAPDEPTPPSPLEHWAFQTLQRPNASSIDELLHRKHLQYGLETSPPADRTLAIRRVYLDLVGLPPTSEQLQDERPWEEIVDELLARPQYGERWGRHWMDVWRYSDNYGLNAQLRYSQKHMWHWRDWIVQSLNDDKGYDRMLLEMLAGDELEPLNDKVVAGTGFLARNYYLFNRTTWLDATIEHTGKAFLGLTLNCAKCHDHKYDPISQQDYYNFRAIFEPHQVRLDPVAGQLDFEKDGLPRVFDDHLDAETFLHVRGDEKNPDHDLEIQALVPALFSSFQPAPKSIELPREAYSPGMRNHVQQAILAAAKENVAEARETVKTSKRKLAASLTTQEDTPEKIAAQPAFELTEDFDASSESWTLVGEVWKFADGKLLQTESSRDTQAVRLNRSLPRDFEFEADYVTTGGTTYKSISFQFDTSEDHKHRNFVYTSAHAPGPKVQFAFDRNGNSSYPADGRSPQKIEVGKPIKLRFAIRDRLANVWLNGKFLLAYEYPSRENGNFEIATFDATVALDRIQLRALPKNFELHLPNARSTPAASSPKIQLEIATRHVDACEAELRALQAVVAADNEKKKIATSEERFEQLARNAVELQFEAKRLRAEHDVLAFRAKDANKSQAASKLLEQLRRQAPNAIRNLDYQSVRASRKALETPAHKETDYPNTYSATSTGRRLSLARWVVDERNPLTARVAVNHIWMRHFGTPLVESVSDFGLRAAAPVHQDILDFLACELIDSGWSMKHLHRVIVASKAYQRSSLSGSQENLKTDRDNNYLWRMNSRRMESQVLRDSLLSLGGELDLTIGGPSIPVGTSKRRSLYYRHSRDDKDKFLSTFDDADFLQCYRRQESVLPQQALALSNSKLSHDVASKITAKLTSTFTDDSYGDFTRRAFALLLGREATAEELLECNGFQQELKELYQDLSEAECNQRIRNKLVHALLNHNDFVSIR